MPVCSYKEISDICTLRTNMCCITGDSRFNLFCRVEHAQRLKFVNNKYTVHSPALTWTRFHAVYIAAHSYDSGGFRGNCHACGMLSSRLTYDRTCFLHLNAKAANFTTLLHYVIVTNGT